MADEQKKGDQQQKKPKPPKGEKGQQPVEAKAGREAPRHAAKERPRLRSRFEKEVSAALMKELELKNPMAVPRLNKIVVNMGVGEATQNAKLIDPAVNELGQIAGQKPVVTRAKKSIAAFKVREGHADWRDGDAARRPHVRIFRSPDQHRAAARTRLQAACRPNRSMAAAITRWDCTTS